MGCPHLSRLGKLVGDEPNHQQAAGRPRLHLVEIGVEARARARADAGDLNLSSHPRARVGKRVEKLVLERRGASGAEQSQREPGVVRREHDSGRSHVGLV